MSLFGNLKSDGLEESQDRVGGFGAIDADIVTGVVKAFYAGKSSGGAHSITAVVTLEGGKEYRETVYITNKKGENFFLNKQDQSKKVPLPGFTIADDFCLATTGLPLADQEFEEKVLNIYDYDAKKELPKGVQVAMAVVGQTVSFGVLKELVNKNEKKGDEYVPTAETREQNVIDKVFHTESKKTVVELKNGADEAQFWDKWLENNKGKVRDRREIKDGQAGAPGKAAPKSGESSAAPAKKSLFGK